MVRHKIVNPPPKMRHLWKVKTYCSKGDFTMSRKITDCKQTGSLSVSKQKLFIYSIGQNVCPVLLRVGATLIPLDTLVSYKFAENRIQIGWLSN